MSEITSNNRRIAKNTIYLYVRLFFVMIVALYTSRVILDVLGATDYGIYNVVGGVASSLAFLSSAFSNATQRYLNFEMGRNDSRGLGQVFNLNLIIFLIYAILAVIFVEILGTWLINNKLDLGEGRTIAAFWVLHSTAITLFVTLLTSVYESVLIARENMKVYAYIGIIEVVFRLIIVLYLAHVSFDKLVVYAILSACLTMVVRAIPTIYCIRNYKETKIKPYWNKSQFADMFKFTGWNLAGTSIFILNDQGLNILLNIFFGPAINAARALSVKIKQMVTSFANGFFTAIRPQIVKSYAANNLDYFRDLIFISSKYTVFMLWLICLPIILRINDILALWLVEVPDMTSEFVVWMLLFCLVNSLCDPLWQGIQAVGNLAKFVLYGNLIYSLVFPLSWVAFKLGASALIAFQLLVIIRIAYLIVTYYVFNQNVSLPVKQYMTKVLLPILKTVGLSYIIAAFVDSIAPFVGLSGLVLSCITSAILAGLSIFFIGISRDERKQCIMFIKKKICKS